MAGRALLNAIGRRSRRLFPGLALSRRLLLGPLGPHVLVRAISPRGADPIRILLQRLAPQRNAQPSVTLDLLLRAQQRLGQAQLDYIESLSKYNRALVQLRRATGELVETVW